MPRTTKKPRVGDATATGFTKRNGYIYVEGTSTRLRILPSDLHHLHALIETVMVPPMAGYQLASQLRETSFIWISANKAKVLHPHGPMAAAKVIVGKIKAAIREQKNTRSLWKMFNVVEPLLTTEEIKELERWSGVEIE